MIQTSSEKQSTLFVELKKQQLEPNKEYLTQINVNAVFFCGSEFWKVSFSDHMQAPSKPVLEKNSKNLLGHIINII